MKKIFRLFMLVAAAAMTLVSCQKNEINDPTPQEVEYKFLLANAETKATVGETCVEWATGDELGSFTKTNNGYSKITVTDGLASFSVYSSGGLSVGDKIYFYYPYDREAGSERTAVSMSISTTQNGVDNMPMASLPFTVTTASEENQTPYAGEIKMANLGSVIEFNVYTETAEYADEIIESVTFEANENIAGAFTFDLTAVDYSNKETLAISGYGEKTVVVSASENLVVGTKEAPAVLKMVVAPGSYTGNVVVKTNAATYTFPIASAKEFSRSAIKPLGLKLRANVREENLDVWTLVASVDNMPDGEYVILAKHADASGYGYLPTTATSDAPVYTQQTIFDAVSATIVPESVPSVMVWTFTKSSDKWEIKNSKEEYFYGTDDNKGLRVGDTEDTWTITTNAYNSNAFTMKSTTSSRYVGVYDNDDWRSYKTANASNYGNASNGYQNAQLFFYYHGTLEVKPSVSVSDVTGISARGVVDNELVYSIVNPDGSTESVSCDGTVVTAAGIVDGKVVYSVSENASTEAREGTITITYGEVEKVVKVSQNAPVFTSTEEEILLTSEEGADASITITSDFDWTATLSEGAGFSVSPISYEWADNGKKPVTITASAANASEDGVLDLGTVTFTNSTTEQTITVTVKQESSYVDESLQTATLTFDNNSKRTAFSTASQVWEENGVKFTNAKANSTSNVADYYNPVRCYKSSSIAIEYSSNITQIVFVCGNSSYAIALKNSITTDDVIVSDSNVTVVLSTPSTSYTINQLSAQVQLKSLTVYAVGGGSGGTTPEPTLTERNLTFSSATATATMGEEFTEPTLSGVTDGVTYASSNTEVATVDASTGEVTLVAAGETTITASASANATHAAGEASYTLTVNPAQSGGEDDGDLDSQVTISKSILDISGTTTDGTKVSTMKLDNVITATASTGTNNGKVYNSGAEWRLYMSDSGKVTITAASGYTINTVKFTYNISNSGVLLDGTTQIKSGTVDTVNAQSVTYTVGRTSGTKQGQVKVTAIEVVYQAN